MDKKTAQRHIEALLLPSQGEEAIYEATLFLYENGYSTADDVRMLISAAAYQDVQALIEILKEHV
jgi:hypothetical protein